MIVPYGRAGYVVDASVGIKWVIEEQDTPHADRLLARHNRLVVPDRFYSEIANVLWKRTRRSDPAERISEVVACRGLREILSLDLEAAASSDLVTESLEIGLEIGRSTKVAAYYARRGSHPV